MSIEDEIDSSVYAIRHAVQSIRDSIDTSEIDSDLDLIENECDDLSNLEEDDPDILISNAMDDMGLENFGEQWSRIDVGTANELREAVTRILKEHGYSVG
jgi:hypothetical protein